MNVERVFDSLNLDGVSTLLWMHCHGDGPGRQPFDPMTMLKAQILKHLLQIPGDRGLALWLKRDRRLAKACGFQRRRAPSHGLFTHFRQRLGEETYQQIFNELTKMLIESRIMIGRVVAVDSTHIEACSARTLDNVSGRSDPDARVGRGRRGFILCYRVCCADSELPLAFKVAPCNENDKVYFELLLEETRGLGVGFRQVVADSQYSSENVRNVAEWFGAEPIIPVRRDSRARRALRVGMGLRREGLQVGGEAVSEAVGHREDVWAG